MITLKKFVKQLDEGKITDFKQCIAELPNEYIIELIKRGIAIDEIVKRGDAELIIKIIRYGHGQEYYSYWKHNSDNGIRKALVSRGYALDEFINDKNYDVRIAVVYKEHKYAIQIMNRSKKEWEAVREIINRQPNPSIELFQAYMASPNGEKYGYGHRGITREGLQFKLEGLQKEPTLMEKTMSIESLIETENPLWTKGIACGNIPEIRNLYALAKQKDKTNLMDEIIDDYRRNPGFSRYTKNYHRLNE
ncbi:MAG: hypothetical protein D8H99_28530 [Streptococcus sp.]|nr:MAG: hypothetical protein D8H99_28530 [Streptococcus sp.]